jgi:hypothetical protein
LSKVTPKEPRVPPKYPPPRWKAGDGYFGDYLLCFEGVIHWNACLTWKLRAVISGITCFEGVIQRKSCLMKLPANCPIKPGNSQWSDDDELVKCPTINWNAQ